MRRIMRWYAGATSFPSWVLAGLILVAAALFMLYSAWQESAIMDELAHIPAGYGYVHALDYRLNPEHPPLIKALAALPLLAFQPNFPEGDPAWTTMVNGQWDMGSAFLYRSGNDADRIVRVSRLFPILLTLLLIAVVYAWARERLGRFWGLVPAFFTGLSPIVLAHGHYVTTDIGAALGIILASWRAVRYLAAPTRRNFWYAGLALGAAELMKFSAVLLLPYFAFLFFVHWLANRRKSLWTYIRAYVLILLVAYLLVVYPVYALFTVNYPAAKQMADTKFLLGSFAGGPPSPGANCHLTRCLAELDIWASDKPVLRPLAQYALGVLMVQQRAAGGNTAYFMGKVSAAGSHLYFPIVYLLKETLPALLFLLFGLWAGLSGFVRRAGQAGRLAGLRAYLQASFPEFAMLAFVAFYWAYSIASPLNIGVRHILPAIPLMYMLAASAWRRWVLYFQMPSIGGALAAMQEAGRMLGRLIFKAGFLVLLLLWALAEIAAAAPHFLAYFNELGGGAGNGYRFVTDSNFDWGQDFLYLRKLAAAHPEMGRVAVDYFGAADPQYYLDGRAAGWNSAKGDPRAEGIHWLAVSVNNLQGAIQPAAPGFDRKPADEYPWLTAGRSRAPGLGGVPEPDYKAGTSIFVYQLE